MSSSRKSLKNAALLNPRASNSWSRDQSKFGKKLLEKMGWKEGQGLGLQNQGISENIKCRLKLDNKGLGYRIKEDQWVEVRNEFSNLLAQLSRSTENEDQLNIKDKKSLKAASESSRSRVHYHKFTHGKDISRYNKEDLIGILGEKEQIESMIPDKKEFIQSGNMEEYFKNKRKNLQTNNVHSVMGVENVTENMEREQEQESVIIESLVEKKKRRRKHSIEQIENLDRIESNSTNIEDSTLPTSKKKSKKDIRKQEDKSERTEGACNVFSTFEEIQFEISQPDSIAVDKPVKKRKKIQTNNVPSVIGAENVTENLEREEQESVIIEPLVEKRKRRQKHSIDQIESNSTNIEDSTLRTSKKNSKKEIRKQEDKSERTEEVSNVFSTVGEIQFEISQQESIAVDKPVKKRKKIQTNNVPSVISAENITENLEREEQESVIIEPLVEKRKQRRKHSIEQIEILDRIESNSTNIEDSALPKSKKKSKKNIRKQEDKSERTEDTCNVFSAVGEIQFEISQPDSIAVDKPVKKRKKIQTNNVPSVIGAENVTENLERVEQESVIIEPLVEKRKRRQKHSIDQIESNSTNIEDSALPKSKKKSKKNIRKQEDKSERTEDTCNVFSAVGEIQFEISQQDSIAVDKPIEKKKKQQNDIMISIDNHPKAIETSIDLCNETEIIEKSPCKHSPKIDVKPLSKAERIVRKARLLKRLQSQEITHAFIGTNLTEIPGYGTASS